MKRFKVSVQIGFYSEPYAHYAVLAYNKQDALARVNAMLPKYTGHRFLNAVMT